MSDLNQVQVEREILRLSELLEHATTELAKRLRNQAEARVAHKKAYAMAYLSSDGPVEERKQHAILATIEELQRLEMGEAVVDAAKEAGRNLREQVAGLRSLNVNLRAVVG